MTVYFPDLSSFQAGISLSGALAVAVKATQGNWYTNPFYTAMREAAARDGVFFTAYHFLEEGDPDAQADHALSVIGKTTPAMIDFEPVDPGAVLRRAELTPLGASYPALADCAAFIDRYRAGGGVTHSCYLPRWYWARSSNGLRGAPLGALAERGMRLWSSDYTPYTDAGDGAGWQPYGGMTPTFWQYTSTLAFGGDQNVDFSAFRGSRYAGKQDAKSVAACLAELKSMMLTGEYPPVPVPPPPAGDVRVPVVRGMTAVRAHNAIAAAHLEPVNPGIPASDIAIGTSVTGLVKAGTRVTLHAASAPVLKEGAAGSWVQIAQTDLNKAGAHLAVDGRYGPVTSAAVSEFQGSRGLARDGITGPVTWGALGAL